MHKKQKEYEYGTNRVCKGKLQKRDITLISLKDNIDAATNSGKFIMNVFAALAQREYQKTKLLPVPLYTRADLPLLQYKSNGVLSQNPIIWKNDRKMLNMNL